jgi:sulfur relay (sulfurtransferase) DsrC/TusE family protein
MRTVTNLMEMTKYTLNFYLYCMINPDIRMLCLYKLRWVGQKEPNLHLLAHPFQVPKL